MTRGGTYRAVQFLGAISQSRRLSTHLSELPGSQVFRFYSVTLLRRFRVQPDRADAILVARITAPAFRPSLSGLLMEPERFSCRQYRHIFTVVMLIWCYTSKAAMTVLLVVPCNKSIYPLTSLFRAAERLRWIRRRVFHRAEQSLGIRIIVVDRWSAK